MEKKGTSLSVHALRSTCAHTNSTHVRKSSMKQLHTPQTDMHENTYTQHTEKYVPSQVN